MSSISLCIPAFNAAWCLPRLLQSAQNQLIPFDEILVYDDCSNDNTAEIAEAYGAKVIRGSVNVGCAMGKNELAKIAKGDWLHFHDADDDILPNFTTVASKWINANDSPDIVIMHYHYMDSLNGIKLGEPEYDISSIEKAPILFTIENKLVNFALIKRIPFIEIAGFDTDPLVLYNEDRAFYTKASIKGLSFGYESELTCINYYYSKSMSVSNRSKCARAQYYVWKKVIGAIGEKYKKEVVEQIFHCATYAATASDWITLWKLLSLAKQLSPDQIPESSPLFRFLFKFNPFGAYFIREVIIKYLTNKRKNS